MAMDAVPFDLLRSSLDELKLRFRAANDPGSPSKAWLVHVHDKGDEKPAIFARADGFDSPTVKPSPSTCQQSGVPAIGRRNPRFQRCVRLNGHQRLGPICEDAARLLDGLPTAVQSRLWRGLPAGTELTTGPTLWVLAVFELANANVFPLRDARRFPIDGEQAKTIFAPESQLPADADWYATLPDFAAASVQAIAILQSWLFGADAGEPINVESAAESVWRSYFNLPDDVCDLMARLMDNWPELRQSLTQAEQATVRAVCRLLPEQPPKHTVAGVPDLFATRQFLEAVLAFNEAMPTRKASGRGGKRSQKKAGRKPSTADKINEACKVWIDYEREGKGQKEFCDWWNGDKKVGRVSPKWLEAKLALVRKLQRDGRVPAEFTNKLKPLRRVKSIAKKTVKNSHRSR